MRQRYLTILGLGIAVLTVGAYFPGLYGGPVLDDVTNFEPLADFLDGKLTLSEVLEQNSSGPGGRSVGMLTFAANYATTGDLLWPLKATNLAIHISCGLVIFYLGALLFERANVSTHRAHIGAAILTSLWLLSPMSVSTVLYVIQRMAQLSALFCLLGIVCYAKGRSLIAYKPRIGTLLVAVAFLVCLPLAVLSKENGAVLPLLLLIVEVCFFGFRGNRGVVFSLKSLYFITIVIPLVAALIITAARPGLILDGYASRDFSLMERLLTESRILWGYAYDLMLPRVHRMGVFHDDYVVSTSLGSPYTTIIACVAWAAVIVATLRGICSSNRTLWFGIAFFLAAHVVESTVLPLELVFEHRNYLPAFGVYFSSVFLGIRTWDQWPVARRGLIAILAIMSTLFALGTFQRSLIWSDIGTMLKAAEQSHPNSPRLQAELAGWAMSKGDYVAAMAHLNMVKKMNPALSVAVGLQKEVARCIATNDSGEFMPETTLKGDLLPTHPYTLSAMTALVIVHEQGMCKKRDIRPIALQVKKLYGRSHSSGGWLFNFMMGRMLEMSGELAAAFAFWSEADALDPTRLEPGLMRVRILMDLHAWPAASTVLNDVKARDNGRIQRHTALIAEYDEQLRRAYAEQRR
ncbi:MAG: hypothetical protein NFCOHLIN_02121 [Gammaproteobacteria bacterium]|nr:hypothetical protein [Gammaproteobacteria bacterium]